jgi:ketosteroid isomerase-like protein
MIDALIVLEGGYKNSMSTKDTTEGYLAGLQHLEEREWASFLAQDMTFSSNGKVVHEGKDTYLQGTKRFFSRITAVDVKGLLVDGDQACVVLQYELQSPQGKRLTSEIAEMYTVKHGKIRSYAIYYDNTPYPTFLAQE